jgi:hypothetical protein
MCSKNQPWFGKMLELIGKTNCSAAGRMLSFDSVHFGFHCSVCHLMFEQINYKQRRGQDVTSTRPITSFHREQGRATGSKRTGPG